MIAITRLFLDVSASISPTAAAWPNIVSGASTLLYQTIATDIPIWQPAVLHIIEEAQKQV